MNARDEAAKQALSDAGAQCGDCGDQPGDRICPDCERCYGWYVAALRKAGWAPRAEVLNEAADVAEDMYANGINGMRIAKRLRAMASPAAAPVPVKTAADETGDVVYVFNRKSVNRSTKHIASAARPGRTLCGLEASLPIDRPAHGDTLHLCRRCREHKGGAS